MSPKDKSAKNKRPLFVARIIKNLKVFWVNDVSDAAEGDIVACDQSFETITKWVEVLKDNWQTVEDSSGHSDTEHASGRV